MKKYQQAAAYIAFLTIILTAGSSNGYISSNSSELSQGNCVFQEAILESFEKNDYDGWRKIIGRKNNLRNIVSKPEFEKFVQARSALRKGHYDQAIDLSVKLELDLRNKLSSQIFG